MKRPYTALLCLALVPGLCFAQAQTTPAAPVPAAPASSAASQPTPPKAIPAANYVASGNLYYNQGQFEAAYVAFQNAVTLEPQNAEALQGLGRSQVKLRLFNAAIETLKRLISVDSRNVRAYVALAQAYQQQYIGAGDPGSFAGNLTEALRVLTDAETLAQAQTGDNRTLSLGMVWNERGYVYKLQGDAAKAIDAFKQATALQPDNSIILFNLGDMYRTVGDLPTALDYLQQAVVADPRDPYNRAYYAKLLALTGNLTAAKPEAAQAARLDAKNAYAVGQYGVVSYLAKDSVTAKAQLTRAVALAPLNYPEFYYYLGRLSLDAGDFKTAREQLTRAVVLGSSNAEYAYYLGLSYERGAGVVAPDRLKAKANYERALQLSPSYKLAQEGLARVK